MNIQAKKQALRKKMMQLRNELNLEKKRVYDQLICRQLWAKVLELNAEKIHVYLPMGAEVDLFALIQKALDRDKTIICPKTLAKRRLEHLVLEDLEQLEDGYWGTTHPASGIVHQGSIDLIIIPGLAFDQENYRLGYGGGYYDNFIKDYPKAYKLAVAYPFQIVEDVPKEAHDVQLDAVLYQSMVD